MHRVAGELRGAGRLDTLDGGGPASNLRALFSTSYSCLDTAAGRLFRLLGLHPGPDLTAPAAGSLAGVAPAQVAPMLAALIKAHLVTEHTTGRYTFHDLLRIYAAELADTHDPDSGRRAAVQRMLDHYLQTAHAADRRLYPHRNPITPAEPVPGVTPEDHADSAAALTWLRAEHKVLRAVVHRAALQRLAITAAARTGDRSGQAYAHHALGRAHSRLGQHADAMVHIGHALELFAELDDPIGQAHAHGNMAKVCEWQGQHRAALGHARRSLELFRATDDRAGQARALNGVGWYHTLLGEYGQALATCQQALALALELSDTFGAADAWDSVGCAHQHLGNHDEAITCFRHALDLYRDLSSGTNEADTLIHLGDTHHAAGNHPAARAAWSRALTILERLHHPSADTVRGKLHGLDHPGAR